MAHSPSSRRRSVAISVPATTANLGPGFDSLGAALELRNIFRISLRDDDLIVGEATGPESAGLVFDAANYVTRAFRAGWRWGGGAGEAPGHHIRAEVAIPQTRGLGSSSSALVAGAAAGFWLARGEKPHGEEFLSLLGRLEGHPDNVTPAAVGGLVCAAWNAQANKLAAWKRLKIHASLTAVLLIPSEPLSTEKARAALPQAVSLADAIHNAARTPLVVEGLRTGDLPLLARAMEDRLHEPYRESLVPVYRGARELARERGLPCCLSGAGPSMIAWTRAGHQASELAAEFDALARGGAGGRVLVLKPSAEGWREEPEG
jgi:homoserine kinase